ncbi:hypothetical protein CBL_10556 [Carabus blaptoides fortunei]
MDPDEVVNQLDNIDELSEEGYIDQLRDILEEEHTQFYKGAVQLILCSLQLEILWDSMHDMLQRLLELKGFCDDMSTSIPELHISSNEWVHVDLIVSALEPAKIASKAMQSEKLTAGDFWHYG